LTTAKWFGIIKTEKRKGDKKMKVIQAKTKVELSTEEFKALNDARIILANIEDLLDNGYNTLFTDDIEWADDEITNAITLLDELAQDEITITQ
jgi:hypothetical protein